MKTQEDTSTANVAMPPSNYPTHGNNWKMFTVPPQIFRRFETGRNKFERWSKYLDLTDDTQTELYNYAKNNRKNTIVLQCAESGALRSIRRRAMNEM